MFDYTVLQVVWWALIGTLLIGFALTDGFDMGACVLLPFVARNDTERRVVVNAVGATWEGNQVWFVTAGGATFAAWPRVYATAFSGFYIALLLVLFALFFRPVGFDYRGKISDPRWRGFWDWALFGGSLVPALVFGVAFGNLLQGVPFEFDADLRSTYTGSFFALLNPFALLCGLVSLSMLVTHGAALLQLKTDGAVRARAARAQRWAGLIGLVLFALAGVWVATALVGFRVQADGTAVAATGAWMDNYARWPAMLIAPALGLLGLAGAAALSGRHSSRDLGRNPGRTPGGNPGHNPARDSGAAGFLCSGAAIIGIILTAGFSMFPFVMPSSTDTVHSLTAWNSTSSALTLEIMLFAVIVFLPLILVYTSWVYKVMFGRVTNRVIEADQHTLY